MAKSSWTVCLKDQLKRLDIYKFEPAPRFSGGTFPTFRGGVGSVITIAIILAYIAITCEKFANAPPTVSMMQASTNNDASELPEVGITFRINDAQLVPSIPFFNDSFFSYHMSMTTVTEQDRLPRVIVDVNASSCDLSGWAGWLGRNATFCPSTQPLHIRGRYTAPSYTFFRIDVLACVSVSVSGNACAPMSEIETLIRDGRFNLLLHYKSKDPLMVDSWESPLYLVQPQQWTLFEGIYRKNVFNAAPNLLTSFSERTFEYVSLIQEKTMIRPPATSRRGRYVLTLYARMSELEAHQTFQQSTSLDLIGQWGALFGTICSVFGIYLYSFAENKFLKLHPRWANITGNFEVDSTAPVAPENGESVETQDEREMKGALPLLHDGDVPKGSVNVSAFTPIVDGS